MSGNPILKSVKSFFLYLLFWCIITVLYINLLNIGINVTFSRALTDGIIFNILYAAFGLSFWYSAKFLSIENNQLSKVVLSHIVGAVLITIIWLIAGYFITFNIVSGTDNYSVFFFKTIQWRAIIGILVYFLLTSFYYIVIYYSGFQERKIKETELKNLISEAELKNLKFQINPHFIFNSLNSMSALTEIDPKRAKQMILKLADFLRYILATNDKQKNSLTEELKNIRLYLDIEKIRFEEKFEYEENIDTRCAGIQIPSMILQPLFENAIKHAVYETLDKVIIKLNCEQQDSFLKISLENNFDGESVRKGTGVGLKNISDRLKLIYQRDNLMEIKKESHHFKVTIYFPLDSNG